MSRRRQLEGSHKGRKIRLGDNRSLILMNDTDISATAFPPFLRLPQQYPLQSSPVSQFLPLSSREHHRLSVTQPRTFHLPPLKLPVLPRPPQRLLSTMSCPPLPKIPSILHPPTMLRTLCNPQPPSLASSLPTSIFLSITNQIERERMVTWPWMMHLPALRNLPTTKICHRGFFR